MKFTPGAILVQAIREWNPFGPEAYERRDRNRTYRRARRKARRGETLTEDEYEILRTTKETAMLQGKLTHTGAGLAASSPFVGILVTAFVPHIETKIVELGIAPVMCAAEAMNCITAGQLAFGLVSGAIALLGGALASIGRKRAEKRHEAELAAAQSK